MVNYFAENNMSIQSYEALKGYLGIQGNRQKQFMDMGYFYKKYMVFLGIWGYNVSLFLVIPADFFLGIWDYFQNA